MSAVPPVKARSSRSAAEDYRTKTVHEASLLARCMRESGHPVPFGDATSGVMLVVEQPIGPRLMEALKRSLESTGLMEAYVTWSSTGLLREEILVVDPAVLVAVGAGTAGEIDALEYPLARGLFSDATEGVWFSWRKGTAGLLLPSLAPALHDEEDKRRFWRAFLTLRDVAPPPRD